MRHLDYDSRFAFFSQWGDAIFGPSLLVGQWHHLAVTHVGQVAALYVDGIPIGSQVMAINRSSGTQMYFGRQPGAFKISSHLIGSVDEIAVFSRALSNSEVAAIASMGKCGQR